MFEHPKLCFKYIKHGDRRAGCKEGSNCNYVHPKLCNSYKSGVCSREKCHFFHIKGTKISPKEEERPMMASRAHSNVRHQNAVINNRESQSIQNPTSHPNSILNRVPNQSPDINRSSSQQNQNYVTQRDFLELEIQLKAILEQLQLLVQPRPLQAQPERILQRTSPWGVQ